MMARMPRSESLVDTQLDQSVSFAPHHPSQPAQGTDGWRPTAVGPGRPATGSLSKGGLGDGVNGYPIQPAKVQGPPLRGQTLARDRLLVWLSPKPPHRVNLPLPRL